MIPNPHDSLFKAVFARPEHARGELQSILPYALAQAIDWATLVLMPGSFQDPDLAQSHADLLFSARLRGGREALIYLLEHQSTSDRYMALRLLRYLVRIWERWLENHDDVEQLPVIVPLVFYHGEKPWSAPLSFESLVQAPRGLENVVRPYLPSFRYLLDDLSQVPDEQLRRRALPVLALLAVACLRDLRHKDVLEAVGPWVNEWVDFIRALPHPDDMRPLARYVYAVKGAAQVDIFLWFLEREVGPEANEIMKTYAEELIEQGLQDGRVTGQREMLLKLLRQRFGYLNARTEQRIATATGEQLDAWTSRILSAATLGEVLAG